MPRGEDLRTTADALDGSIVVCGLGDAADTRFAESIPGVRVVSVSDLLDGTATPGTGSPESDGSAGVAAAVIVVDPVADGDALADLRAVAATGVFTVAVVPGGDTDPDALATMAAAVDGVLLAGGGRDPRSDPRTRSASSSRPFRSRGSSTSI